MIFSVFKFRQKNSSLIDRFKYPPLRSIMEPFVKTNIVSFGRYWSTFCEKFWPKQSETDTNAIKEITKNNFFIVLFIFELTTLVYGPYEFILTIKVYIYLYISQLNFQKKCDIIDLGKFSVWSKSDNYYYIYIYKILNYMYG